MGRYMTGGNPYGNITSGGGGIRKPSFGHEREDRFSSKKSDPYGSFGS